MLAVRAIVNQLLWSLFSQVHAVGVAVQQPSAETWELRVLPVLFLLRAFVGFFDSIHRLHKSLPALMQSNSLARSVCLTYSNRIADQGSIHSRMAVHVVRGSRKDAKEQHSQCGGSAAYFRLRLEEQQNNENVVWSCMVPGKAVGHDFQSETF